MITSVLLVLMHQAPGQITEPVTLPNTTDIQLALLDDWVMSSSTGQKLHNYAVRNLNCMPVPLDKKYTETQNTSAMPWPDTMHDKPISVVQCSYEAAIKQSRHSKKLIKFPKRRELKPLSKRQIKNIPEKLWRPQKQDFAYMSRTICKYMGRIPNEGECDYYWAVFKSR